MQESPEVSSTVCFQAAKNGGADDMASFKDEIRHEVSKLTQENRVMRQQLEKLSVENQQLRQSRPERAQTSPGKYAQYSELGCISDVLELTCPDEKRIFTTSAVYGKYTFACDDCCPPNPSRDCTELVSENRPEDWIAIKYYCDNKTTCEYENRGSPIDDCQENYIADYLQIFYDCVPDTPSQPVGFTVHADTGAESYYSAGQIVHYDSVLTNEGGHYNHNTSAFHCPYDGVYMFSLSLQAYYNDAMDAYICRNNETLSYAMAYTTNGYQLYPTASSTIIAPCERGDVIWVRAATEGTVYGENGANTFSGYLLYVYVN